MTAPPITASSHPRRPRTLILVTGLLAALLLSLTGAPAAATDPQLGTTWAWGDNGRWQLGNDTTTSSSIPVTVAGLDDEDVEALAAGAYHSLALLADGTVRAWGWNSSGQLGNNSFTSSSTPVTVAGLTGVTAIAAGDEHSLALLADGTVRAWGNNSSGQLGDGTILRSWSPVTVVGLDGKVVAIAAGAYHSLAVLEDGTVRTWGWGIHGQLGNDDSFTSSSTPVTVAGLDDDDVVVALAAGSWHSLALLADGTVRAWGWNSSGQLGNPNNLTIIPREPQLLSTVAGLNGKVVAIAAGQSFSLALLADGTVRTWGNNSSGQLGDGTTLRSWSPVTVVGLDGTVVAIAAYTVHSLALLADGTVQSWGDNRAGQLGNDSSTLDSPTPVTVDGLTDVTAIAAGAFHSLAVQAASSTLLFEGFAAPVDNDSIVNLVTAKATVPMRWRLTDDGVPVADPAAITTITSRQVACPASGTAEEQPVEETTTSKSGLIYQDDGYWQYNWATDKTWSGTCRQFDLTLSDDSVHTALFRFR